MKYAIVDSNGLVEVRQDMYPLKEGAIPLTDEQYDQLISGKYILQNGQVVANPNARTLGN